jgi:hypothetical protein
VTLPIFAMKYLTHCMNFSTEKTVKGALALLLLDILIIWIWAKNEDLGPGSAMVIYLVVPFVFIINVIIGGLLFFIKRAYTTMFFVNSIVASIVTNWLFTVELSNQSRSAYDSWAFNLKDTTFTINKSNNYDEFGISYSNDGESSTEFMSGKYKQNKDTLMLKVDSGNMYIHGNKLYNFRNSRIPIPLKSRD